MFIPTLFLMVTNVVTILNLYYIFFILNNKLKLNMMRIIRIIFNYRYSDIIVIYSMLIGLI